MFTANGNPDQSGEWKGSLWQVDVNRDNGSAPQKPRRLAQWADVEPNSVTTTANGKILAFIKTRFQLDAYVGELEQGLGGLRTPRRLTLDNHANLPDAWTPESRNLLFVSNRNGQYELFKQGLNESVPERIVSSAAGEVSLGSGVSPDGSWILYWQSARREGTAPPTSMRLVRQPIGGGPPETVLKLPYSKGREADFFCPKKPGNPCVLRILRGKSLNFYTLDPVRGKGDPLGEIEVDSDVSFGWAVSPDGSRVAVVGDSHKDRIEILTLSTRAWHAGACSARRLSMSASNSSFFSHLRTLNSPASP